MKDANFYLGKSKRTNLITKACKGLVSSVYNYFWLYEDDYIKKYLILKN